MEDIRDTRKQNPVHQEEEPPKTFMISTMGEKPVDDEYDPVLGVR